jgi:DNA-binding NarL/FixJ family response regulator
MSDHEANSIIEECWVNSAEGIYTILMGASMSRKPALVLLVAEQGYMQKGLLTLLRSAPTIDAILSPTSSLACSLLRVCSPEAVLIDSSISLTDREIIREAANRYRPGTPCVLLMSSQPNCVSGDGSAHKVDYVICKEHSVSDLIKEIEGVIDRARSKIDT